MQNVTAVPAHLLLNRKDDAKDKTEKTEQAGQTGPSSAFAQYAFGPLDLSGGKSVATGAAVTGTSSTSGVNGGTTAWMAQLYT